KQASIIGSQFIASYEQAGEYVIPTIRGEAYMSAEATLFMDENDPFAWGIQL
ncbi:proline racemase family protein, partial [Acinetobacter baumannii]